MHGGASKPPEVLLGAEPFRSRGRMLAANGRTQTADTMAQTNSLSELMPGQANFIDGAYSIDGAFRIRQLHTATLGDLQRGEYVLETEFGNCHYAVLGGSHYFVNWGAYDLRSGLSYFAELNQPFIELHFQLDGSIRTAQNAFVPAVHLRPGNTNLLYMPPGSSQFTVDMDTEGASFEVQLAPDYFAGLAERYPHLFGPFLDKMLQRKAFVLSRAPLPMSAAMWGVIERIRQREASGNASSLFLESQILELLALQFEQLQQPTRCNGHTLSRADIDRLHAAREVLLARMTDPPSLAELARLVGTNEFTLKGGFKALFGTSPYAFALEHKLEAVRTYLLDTDLTIAEIAYRVGYSDPAHLTHAFRNRYGMPPSSLRKGLDG